MPNPLLIVKTANGFAAVEYTGELPPVTFSNLLCFGDLEDSATWKHDGLFSAVKDYFRKTAPTEGVPE